MQIWIAEYIYHVNGKGHMSTLRVKAETYDDARAVAVRQAPAAEFVLNLHPETDDQFLGQVRTRALSLAGKATDAIDDAPDD